VHGELLVRLRHQVREIRGEPGRPQPVDDGRTQLVIIFDDRHTHS
jgi:hypothetical protein